MDRRTFFKALVALAIPASVKAAPAAAETVTLTDSSPSWGVNRWGKTPAIRFVGSEAAPTRFVRPNTSTRLYLDDGNGSKEIVGNMISFSISADADLGPWTFSGNRFLAGFEHTITTCPDGQIA